MSLDAAEPVLEAAELAMKFGGLMAVDGLSLTVQRGRISGLIGPNGAGKTTVLNILSGLQRPTSGTIRVSGRDVTRWPGDRRVREARLLRTFQTVRLFQSMSVLENVLTSAGATLAAGEAEEAARSAVTRLGLDDVSAAMAGILPYGRQRRVEIARAIAAKPQLLLLDEPAAGLSPLEREELAVLLLELAAGGMSILLVEHHMDLVHAVCSEVCVIDFGQPIFAGSVDEAIVDPRVVASYLGSAGDAADDPSDLEVSP